MVGGASQNAVKRVQNTRLAKPQEMIPWVTLHMAHKVGAFKVGSGRMVSTSGNLRATARLSGKAPAVSEECMPEI
jgi:hypothetical protein